MNEAITFKQLLLLTHVYRAFPSIQNEIFLNRFLKEYWEQLDTKPSKKLMRLRLFLLRSQQNYIPRRKFKAFAAREYLIRFTRPSPPLLSGLTPAGVASGSFNRADTSTAPRSLAGSH